MKSGQFYFRRPFEAYLVVLELTDHFSDTEEFTEESRFFIPYHTIDHFKSVPNPACLRVHILLPRRISSRIPPQF